MSVMSQIMANVSVVPALREQYKDGTRIRLIRMCDIQAPPSGTLGTVTGVDDIGTIHMRWDNGSSLGLVPNEDDFEIVNA